VYNRLLVFIEGNGVLAEAQHDFVTKKSNETALQIFINPYPANVENMVRS